MRRAHPRRGFSRTNMNVFEHESPAPFLLWKRRGGFLRARRSGRGDVPAPLASSCVFNIRHCSGIQFFLSGIGRSAFELRSENFNEHLAHEARRRERSRHGAVRVRDVSLPPIGSPFPSPRSRAFPRFRHVCRDREFRAPFVRRERPRENGGFSDKSLRAACGNCRYLCYNYLTMWDLGDVFFRL